MNPGLTVVPEWAYLVLTAPLALLVSWALRTWVVAAILGGTLVPLIALSLGWIPLWYAGGVEMAIILYNLPIINMKVTR